ncbi:MULTISPECIES: LPS assembly lipoprotein LptE [Methylorubrum]|uniref:LPS-assembly lipoprotein n=1 Tax=Methylorubrum suomiense TaxID=144191 RepID=A0ABQ4USR9_9HYPH|nr:MULTISPECIES: LPS assembly lipoprotein LptE [Methylobacteriaceae]GJE74057.1 hypothetical protein BGCPKDLD_0624 [Methylorubrum suomiense]
MGVATDRPGARLARLALALGLALNLGACFRPLYGPTASGESMQTVLAAIQVDDVVMAQDQERLGHYLRSELIFALDGSGQAGPPKRYRLKMQGSEQVQTPIVSSTTARAEAGTIVGTVRYALESVDGRRVITEGVATSTATYDRSIQRFASLRAARDAEIRLAKVLAEQIKTRIASVLAVKPNS